MRYILLLTLLLSGCSAFQPKQQQVTLTGKKQQVFVNDRYITIPTSLNVDRDKTLTITKKEGKNIVYIKTISPVPSLWGKLDAWGVYFLYPGIGLFTPGALELETDIVNID